MTSINDDNIVYGGPELPRFIKNEKSIGEFFLNILNSRGNDVLLMNGITGEKITGTKLRNEGIRLAKCLRNLGLKKGDIIGICSENRDEFIYVLFANFYLETTLAPINTTYTEREINHALNLSKPTIVFASLHTIDKVVAVTKNLDCVKQIIIFGHQCKYPSVITYLILLNSLKDSDTTFTCEPTNLDESIVLLLCSSGTTGLPKGVQLSQNNVLTVCEIYWARKDEEEIKLCPDVKSLCVLPWFHTFGLHLLISSIIRGDLMIFLPKFEERYFLETIEKYKVNTTFLVPPLLVFLAKNEIVDQYDISSLKFITSGAAPISKELIQSVKNRIDVPWIIQGYGMSEGTCSFAVQNHHIDNKLGSVGPLHRGLWGKVVDTDTGKTLGANESGEICMKGKVIMKGYINNEEATRNMIDEDGWLHTGDIGYFDNDRDWFIVDRLKELIKYKGFQVPPAEIEALLLTHPGIRDAAVIGKPDENAGELPLGFIVKNDGENITEREIINFIAARSSPPKRLHGGVIFLDKIPKNPSGKILRRQLRDLIKNQTSKL